jgi:hypothetical protein
MTDTPHSDTPHIIYAQRARIVYQDGGAAFLPADSDAPHRPLLPSELSFTVEMDMTVLSPSVLRALGFRLVQTLEGWRCRLATDVERRLPGTVQRSVRRAWEQNIALRWEYFDRG